MPPEHNASGIDGRLAELQGIIDSRIGPAASMGIRIDSFDRTAVTLSAPLAKNLNHHDTAFGGSLYSIAAVAGWALLELRCLEAGLKADIVVGSAEVSYLLPVTDDYSIRVWAERESDIDTAIGRCGNRGKGVVSLLGRIVQDDDDALTCKATYALIARPQ